MADAISGAYARWLMRASMHAATPGLGQPLLHLLLQLPGDDRGAAAQRQLVVLVRVVGIRVARLRSAASLCTFTKFS